MAMDCSKGLYCYLDSSKDASKVVKDCYQGKFNREQRELWLLWH